MSIKVTQAPLAKVIQMQPDKYLTGRRRFNRSIDQSGFHGLKLQVEKAVFTPGLSGKPGAWKCYWFDATPEDVGKDELA
jgi:hypothetical protein